MNVYLVQHGDAVIASVDPQRPLSAAGRRDVDALGALLESAGISATTIVHSGKLRARQTAEALALRVGAKGPPVAVPGLAPNDPVSAIASQLAHWAEDSLVVGHQPFIGRLVATLLTGHEEGVRLGLVPGSAVCLSRTEHGAWLLGWMLPPRLARADSLLRHVSDPALDA